MQKQRLVRGSGGGGRSSREGGARLLGGVGGWGDFSRGRRKPKILGSRGRCWVAKVGGARGGVERGAPGAIEPR